MLIAIKSQEEWSANEDKVYVGRLGGKLSPLSCYLGKIDSQEKLMEFLIWRLSHKT